MQDNFINVILNITDNEELESVLPIDRHVAIDSNNMLFISDYQFKINEEEIKEITNG